MGLMVLPAGSVAGVHRMLRGRAGTVPDLPVLLLWSLWSGVGRLWPLMADVSVAVGVISPTHGLWVAALEVWT